MPVGFGHSVIGSREKNQDSYLVDDKRGLYAVADGVGGGLHGEVASAMAVKGLAEHTQTTTDLKTAIQVIQKEILAESLRTIGDALMGTTLTAISFDGNKVSLAHVGDSHCYVFSNGVLQLKTEDHESFDESIQATVLNSYLGIPEEVLPLEIQEDKFVVKPGDRLLLCSDGLYRQVLEQRIGVILSKESDATKAAKMLCDEASQAEHSDNVTVVIVDVT